MFRFTFRKPDKTILNSLCKGKTPYLNQSCFTINCRQSQPPKTFTKYLLSTQKSLSPLYKSIVRRVSTETVTQPKKIVGYWLLGCSGMVITAVVLGGVTRLTESGLSMVTWRLLGEKKPSNTNEWLIEFKKYQEYPEYKLLKRDITLDEFKWIWWMEYAHRTWGRLIGAAFYIPAAIFWIKGYLPQNYKTKVVGFGTLIAMQGLMGWYMVKSGLEDRFHSENDIPRVSQYRLAAHLGLALLLYTATLYSGLKIVFPLQKIAVAVNVQKLRIITHISKGLIFLTALSGAFVAGLDAGLVYNSFPKMGDTWIPEDILSFSPFLRNFTENPTTVQFDHRVLATITLLGITAVGLMSRKVQLPKRTQNAVIALVLMGFLQVGLGITTLLEFVPVPLAAMHQSGSLALLTAAIWLTHELKCLKYIPK